MIFERYSREHARDILRYSKRFHTYLLQGDLRKIQLLNDSKRNHVMKALSALSKFLGIYDYWRNLIKSYGLRWSVSEDDIIISRLTRDVDGSVLEWMRKVKDAIPEYATFIDFLAASGLRYGEAVKSWNLIIQLSKKEKLGEYYKAERCLLEHFRYKRLFIRKTKKAFISFVPETIVSEIATSKALTVYVLRERLKRRGLGWKFGGIREYWATYMTKYLRQPEIDFLQGRVSSSVFMRNYFNPVWIRDLKERTLKGAKEILKQIAA